MSITLLIPKSLFLLLIPAFVAGLPGCSKTDAPAQAATRLGPPAMGLPPLGSTYEEFTKVLPAGITLSPAGSVDAKAFEISPPRDYYSDIKTARLVAQFKMQGAAVERYWQLLAITKLPWTCGAEDVKLLFEREEPLLKATFEATHRVLLPSGKGAVLSGISRDRMYYVQAECLDAPLETSIMVKYQLIDPSLFADTDDSNQQMIDRAYARWGM